jgi:hypothetical protein
MVNPEKLNNALFALHRILTEARAMTATGDARALAEVLDWAEPLPRMIGNKHEDQTEQFRQYIEAIVERQPRFRHALSAFEHTEEIEC